MRFKKVALISAITLFVAITLVSAYMICTVRKVTVNFAVSTEPTAADIAAENERLDRFVGKSAFLVSASAIADSVSENPYLKVLSVKKRFPSEIVIEIEERKEAVCVENGGKYYMLTEDRFALSEKESNAARADGKPLPLIFGDADKPVVNSTYLCGDGDNGLFDAAWKIVTSFPDARNELEKVEIDRFNEESSSFKNEWNRIIVYTAEGATFTITEANDATDEKLRLLFEVYGSLDGKDRVSRHVVIFSDPNKPRGVDYE